MNRNQKEKWWKTMRKIESRKNDLPYTRSIGHQSDAFIWVPVEEPRFIGWETTITLSEIGRNRKDAPQLRRLLTLLKLDEPRFTRDQEVIKLIRKSNKRYSLIRANFLEQRRREKVNPIFHNSDMPYAIKDVRDVKIPADKFKDRVPEDLRRYFYYQTKLVPATAWSEARVDRFYNLQYSWRSMGGWKYRFEESLLAVKVDQAYSTHRGIPKSDELSERKKLEDKLDQEQWYPKRYGKTYWNSKYEDTAMIYSRRKQWHGILKEAVNYQAEDRRWWSDDYNPFALEEFIDRKSSRKTKKHY